MRKQVGHLQYAWWKYMAVLLIPLVLWCSVFSVLKKPNTNERLHILFLGAGLDTAAMEQELKNYLQDQTTQELKTVQIAVAEYADESYANQLMAATYAYDIIIISQKQMKNAVGQGYFFVLPEQLRTDSLYEETVDGEKMSFGAVIFDGVQKNTFGKYYSGTEYCYAFISPQTVNLYPLNAGSREGDNAAVIAWQWLMEKR